MRGRVSSRPAWRLPEQPDDAAHGCFDVADRDLRVGTVFRWPRPRDAGADWWRIVAILDPEVDELTQRVRAVLEA